MSDTQAKTVFVGNPFTVLFRVRDKTGKVVCPICGKSFPPERHARDVKKALRHITSEVHRDWWLNLPAQVVA